MARSKQPTNKRSPEKRIYISRPLAFEDGSNQSIADFANKVGNAIKGTGRTRSLGSMAVTLMSAQQYSQVRNNLSARDRSRHGASFTDFFDGLCEQLSVCTEARFCIHGLGFMGRNARSSRPGSWTTFGFKIDRESIKKMSPDLDIIKGYFSDNLLPEPVLKPDKLHLSVGEVQLNRLAAGQNADPNIFMPAGLTVPRSAELLQPVPEDIDG